MPNQNKIVIKGARENNLKNIDLEIPRDKLVVITGLSGSGKSSLAFDTIYAEGHRRYVESLSSYARQFLGLMEKPDVDNIEGLSPAISIEQKTTSKNPRSTVGTVTEIYDYLRLLFARIGIPYCYNCGKQIQRQTVQQIVDIVMNMPEGTKFQILAPSVRGRKGEYKEVFEEARREGYVRVRVDGKIRELSETITLDKKKKHNIEIVVDRLIADSKIKNRLTDSIETALNLSSGLLIISEVNGKDHLYSEQFSCIDCEISYEEIAPRMFSFNSPYGACPTCNGLGTVREIDPLLVIPNDELSVRDGAIEPWGGGQDGWYFSQLQSLAHHNKFDLGSPWNDLDPKIHQVILYGSNKEIETDYRNKKGTVSATILHKYEGVIPSLHRRYRQTGSYGVRDWIENYMNSCACEACGGSRLKPESLAVKIHEKSIADVTRFSIKQAKQFFAELKLTNREQIIAHQVLNEVNQRLSFLLNVGLDYLTLDRTAGTLAGGESQRIRLATQIGSQLVGVLYILDEPSIGLHQRDNKRLIETLTRLRDLGNTVLVVEHDRETMEHADHIIDLGPGAGEDGGHIVAQGKVHEIKCANGSITGDYLSGKKSIPIPETRREGNRLNLILKGAAGNNLKSIDVIFPLGKLICVTGVSGSGKSTLINQTLYPALKRAIYRSKEIPLQYKSIEGLELIDKVVDINQSPIGRTPRSNPATYTGLFTPIRDLFSQLPESKVRGYKPGRFSFNVKGGRCEACEGDGILKIEMHFLPDVYITCEACKGLRYNRETLEIKYKGKRISDVLNMTVKEALIFFENIPVIHRKLQTLFDVGLRYIKLGQQATTLSGGEAQRVKLATELSKVATGKTLYLLDEPTTGLHFADIQHLLDVLNRLVSKGNTVIVIEHNMDVIKSADHIIDLGPEGGDFGGQVVATGTPESILDIPQSYTGQFLKKEMQFKPVIERPIASTAEATLEAS